MQVLVDTRFNMMLLDFINRSTKPLLSPNLNSVSKKVEPDFEKEASRKGLKSASPSPPPVFPKTSVAVQPPKLVVRAVVKQVLVALLEDTEERYPRTLVLQVREI